MVQYKARCYQLTSLAKVTKPNPLLLLDCLSCMTTESMTSPNCSKNGVNSLTVTVFHLASAINGGSKTRISEVTKKPIRKRDPKRSIKIGFSSWIRRNSER